MSKADNAAQLELARQFIDDLQDLVQCSSMEYFTLPVLYRDKAEALVEQFNRLDAKEQKQIAAGVHGAKGGAPKGNRNAAKKRE